MVILNLAHSGEIPKFPFIGVVEKSKIKVYAGPNENFEIISSLEKGSKIVVLGHSYGWYRLELPKGSLVYVNKMFVERTEEDKGKVKGGRVNVRAGAGTTFTILGQLNKGDTVTITGEDKDWFKIESFNKLKGWVKADGINFFSGVDKEKSKEDKKEEQKNISEEKISTPIQGVLSDVGNIINRPAAYKLLSAGGDIIYYLKPAEKINLAGYIHCQVNISGYVGEMSDDGIPVVVVEKIEILK
jgi:uncharacterized protein YraI